MTNIGLRVIRQEEAKVLNMEEDNYAAKIVKYIPIEAVSTYIAFRNILIPEHTGDSISSPYGDKEFHEYFIYFFFGALVIGTLARYLLIRDTKLPNSVYQMVISIVAYVVWVFSFGDMFDIYWPRYTHEMAAGILIFFTAITPLIEKLFRIGK